MTLMSLNEFARLNNLSLNSTTVKARANPVGVNPVIKNHVAYYPYRKLVEWHSKLTYAKDLRKLLA